MCGSGNAVLALFSGKSNSFVHMPNVGTGSNVRYLVVSVFSCQENLIEFTGTCLDNSPDRGSKLQTD